MNKFIEPEINVAEFEVEEILSESYTYTPGENEGPFQEI